MIASCFQCIRVAFYKIVEHNFIYINIYIDVYIFEGV